jgi:hypothetical protein
MMVDILALTVEADACVDCACEDDCDDCDDAEVPLLVGLAITFKTLLLLKCMHTQVYFQKKVHQKQLQVSRKRISQEYLENNSKSYGSYFQKLHEQGHTGRANLFTGVFGKQED